MTSLTPTELAEMETDVRKRVAAHVKEHGIAVPVADDIKLINEFFWVRPDSDGRAWDTGRVWVIGQILATYRAIFNSDRAALLQDRKEGEIERLKAELAKEERAHGRTIDERDDAQEAMSQAYYLIVGQSPEWSNLFGYKEAIEEIDDAQSVLRQAAKAGIDK